MPINLTINIDVFEAAVDDLVRIAAAFESLAVPRPVATVSSIDENGRIVVNVAPAEAAGPVPQDYNAPVLVNNVAAEPPKRGPGRPRKEAAVSGPSLKDQVRFPPAAPPPPPHVNVPTENDPQSVIQAAPADLKVEPPPPPPPPPAHVAFDENALAALRVEIKDAAGALMAKGVKANEVMAVFNRFTNPADGQPAKGASSVADADVATCLAALRSLA